jgi:sulfur-carrier protein
MKVRYFAWMKRTVGLADEEVSPPADVKTVGELVTWLRARSAGHAEALAEGAAFDASLAGVREVAFFPPFTGG